MSDPRICVGSVVQIDPAHDEVFGACFLVVTEMKSFGVMGYVTIPGKGEKGGNAFYRVAFDRVHYIGPAEWALPSD
jgi:hypothetical protein